MEQQGKTRSIQAQLQAYIKRRYTIRILRNSILWTSALGSAYILLALIEHYSYLASSIKTPLVFIFLIASSIGLLIAIIPDVFRLLNIIPALKVEEAAKAVGDFYPEISDKLINLLELETSSANSAFQKELIEAAILQKIEKSEPYSFTAIFPYSALKQYIKYGVPFASGLVLILLINANILSEGSARLLQYDQEFSPPAPFDFKHNLPTQIEQSAPLNIQLETPGFEYEGSSIIINGQEFQMNPSGKGTFKFEIQSVESTLKIQFKAGRYYSDLYQVKAVGKSAIHEIELIVTPPAYTQKPSFTTNSLESIEVPEGSVISYSLKTEHTSKIQVKTLDSSQLIQSSSNYFVFKKRFKSNTKLKLELSQTSGIPDSVIQYIQVSLDRHPEIELQLFKDSIQVLKSSFAGVVRDDYGISKVRAAFKVAGELEYTYVSPEILGGGKEASFILSLSKLNTLIPNGSRIEYFFEVYDNDAVNGNKATRTPVQILETPSTDALIAQTNEMNDAIKKALEDKLKQAQELRKRIQKYKEDLTKKQDKDWAFKKDLKKSLEEQKQLQKDLEKLSEEFQKRNELQNSIEQNAEDKALQDQLEQLFEELKNPEEQALLEKIEQMMEKLNKEQLSKELDKLQNNKKETERSLEQLNELFKRLEFEQKADNISKQLEDLAKKQDDLAQKTEQEKEGKQNAEAEKKQDKINSDFKKIEEEFKELEKMNSELETPMLDEKQEELREETQKDLNESKQQMQQGKNKDASKKQKQAADKMEEMAEQLQNQMQQQQMEQLEVDMDAVRQLLENILLTSLDQEQVMKELRSISPSLPIYREKIREEFNIQQKNKMITDSIVALSKRVPQINSTVQEQVSKLEYNIQQSIDFLTNKDKQEGMSKQQYVMTAFNNLAVLLDDVLQNMQKEMSSKMKGQQMCQKKGSGNPMQDIMQQQKGLNEKMKALEQKLKEQGPQKPGQSGKGGSSEEFAKMAREQSAIRRALQELAKEKSKDGKGTGELQKLIEEIEKVEEDIIFKNVRQQTLNRQNEILVKMLESEKADREQNESPERKSKQANAWEKQQAKALEEYLKEKRSSIDRYNTIPGDLQPMYKHIIDQYFKSMNSNQ